ncbi:MAG: DUF503 domain-containing protein [Dehalococcoidia bacterium]|nr:DUF503 domain-containing protein [Dehalococcoidia bacterium]
MYIGILKVKLRLPENQTLKGKRQAIKAIKPIIARVQNRFNVSIAEVEDLDLWQIATLGITCVSNSTPFCNETLSKVVDFIAQSPHETELLDYEIELLTV